ncbi:MAG: hypothetical protein ACPGQM_09095 [Alphaproteobacteria bacterium]
MVTKNHIFEAEPYPLPFDPTATALLIIDRNYKSATAFALSAAVLTYFGFILGPAVGIGNELGISPTITIACLAVAAILFWCDGLEKTEASAD